MSTYTCEACGETFAKGWSDEEAAAEARRAFAPSEIEDGGATVCDGCWQEMRRVLPDLDARYA